MSIRKKLIVSTAVGKKYFSPTPFPPKVWIETTSDCNLRCPFCPRTYSKRARKHMDLNMFSKIIDQIKKESPNLKQLGLMCFGEPLLNPQIFDMIKLARKQLPNTSIEMSTNACLLTKDNVEKLMGSGISWVSVWEKNGNQDTYEKIKYFLGRVKSTNIHTDFGILLFKDNKKNAKKLISEYKKYIGDNINVKTMETHDWGGQVPSENVINKAKGLLKTPCRMPFNDMFIYSTGEVVPCCFDMDARYLMGRFPEQSLKEIWNGAPWTTLRERLLEGKISKKEMCWNCHYYRQSAIKSAIMFVRGKTAYNKVVKK